MVREMHVFNMLEWGMFYGDVGQVYVMGSLYYQKYGFDLKGPG